MTYNQYKSIITEIFYNVLFYIISLKPGICFTLSTSAVLEHSNWLMRTDCVYLFPIKICNITLVVWIGQSRSTYITEIRKWHKSGLLLPPESWFTNISLPSAHLNLDQPHILVLKSHHMSLVATTLNSADKAYKKNQTSRVSNCNIQNVKFSRKYYKA